MDLHPIKIEEWSTVHCYVTGPALYSRDLCHALRDAGLTVRATAGAVEVEGPVSAAADVIRAFLARRGLRD